MIRIEYKNLPSGVHAEADARVRDIVVYLLPGLTPAQRKAALRRLRQEGSRGCGPQLPEGQLRAALAADRLGVAVRSTARAVRQHPFGLLVPALLAGSLLGGFVFASAGAQIPAGLLSGSNGNAGWPMPGGPPGRGGPGGILPGAGQNGGSPDGGTITIPQDVPRQALHAALSPDTYGSEATALLPTGAVTPGVRSSSGRSASPWGTASAAPVTSPAPAASPPPGSPPGTATPAATTSALPTPSP